VSHRLRVAAIVGGVLVVAVTVSIAVAARQLEPRLHEWVTSMISRSLEGEVELGRVQLSWLPFRLIARDLTVRHHGRTDIPPLLVVASFTIDLHPFDLWSSTLGHVRVNGMEISIPPRDPKTGRRPMPDAAGGDDPAAAGEPVIVRRLTATNTRLAIVPRRTGANPKVWDIFELEMENLSSTSRSPFRAALTNPIPHGRIDSQGHFGPWQSDEPGITALTGEYTFAADLGTIAGLEGQLNALGQMDGVLEQIKTRGETRTEAFRLTELEGRSLPLYTSYEAVVNGTRGDVELKHVDVTLGRSQLLATGVVEGTRGVKGKRIVLNVTSEDTDLAELLQFVSRIGRPPATGKVAIDAAFDLPQGATPLLDRLELEGSVTAEQVRFTNVDIQEKIDVLSRRGQGRPRDDTIDEVASNMSSKFTLRKGVATYRGLTFNVKGASVQLNGVHELKTRTLDLGGEVLLTASASRTMTGFKSWLLRPFDPLFRRNGTGTRLVIRIDGTQDQPKVSVDLRKSIRGN
jgi:hypothetical protein